MSARKIAKLEKQIEKIELEIVLLEDKIDQYKKLLSRKEISKADFNKHRNRIREQIRGKRAVIKRKTNVRLACEKKLKEKEEKKKRKEEEKRKKREKL